MRLDELTPEQRELYDRGEAVWFIDEQGPGFVTGHWIQRIYIGGGGWRDD
jgi:hypothetical protein